jgi:NADH:ubiquinone oxidoreductase subunit 3 (subunit A)
MPTVAFCDEPQGGSAIVSKDYELIGLLFIVSLALPVLGILAGSILGPRKPNRIKNDTYECGMETVGSSWVRFKVQYYIFALVFVIFDVEMVLLFPIAAAFGALKLYQVVEAVIFILILAAALVYALKKGALEWS